MQQKVQSTKNSPSTSLSTTPTIIINTNVKSEHHQFDTSTPLNNNNNNVEQELDRNLETNANGSFENLNNNNNKNDRLYNAQFHSTFTSGTVQQPTAQYLNDYNFGFPSANLYSANPSSYGLCPPTSSSTFSFDQFNSYQQQQQQRQANEQQIQSNNYWRPSVTSASNNTQTTGNDYFQATTIPDYNSAKLFTNTNYTSSAYPRFSPVTTAQNPIQQANPNDFNEFTNAANLLYNSFSLPQRSSTIHTSNNNPTLSLFLNNHQNELNHQKFYANYTTAAAAAAAAAAVAATTQSPNSSLSLLTASSSSATSTTNDELRSSLIENNQQAPVSSSSSASSSSSSSCSSSVSSLSLSANLNLNTIGHGNMGPQTLTNNITKCQSNGNTNNSSFEWMKPVKNPSNGKTRTKDKYRVVYSEIQRLELEKEFMYSKYITIKRKAELSQTLVLSERQIKIWFQNRRAKDRKQSRKRGGNNNENGTSSLPNDLNTSSNSANTSSNSIDELMNDSVNNEQYDTSANRNFDSNQRRCSALGLQNNTTEQSNYLNSNYTYATNPYHQTSTTPSHHSQFTLTPFSHHHPHHQTTHNQFMRTFPHNTNSLLVANALNQFHAM